METADEHAIHLQAFQIVDGFRRRRVAVLDEDAVGLNQAVIVWCGMPAELFLERVFGFVVTLDRGDAGQGTDECLNTFDEPLRWGETGLDIDDKEGLAHGHLRGRSRR